MTIKHAIEGAIEGGWMRPDVPKSKYWQDALFVWAGKNIGMALLDPSFWQALGKMEGWDGLDTPKPFGESTSHTKDKMTAMIPHLWSGGTIEQYLETL